MAADAQILKRTRLAMFRWKLASRGVLFRTTTNDLAVAERGAAIAGADAAERTTITQFTTTDRTTVTGHSLISHTANSCTDEYYLTTAHRPPILVLNQPRKRPRMTVRTAQTE